MKHLLDSLRWRLIGAMFFVFVLGLLAALAVDPPDIGEPGAVGWLKYVTEEPYQDFLILVPYTVAALGIMWAVSGWSMKRLASASSIAATIGPNNPVARIPTDQMPTEVRPLIGAFNGALDRLAEAYDTEQRFVAQVAHQLRTPLAVASLRVQRAKAGSPADIAGLEGDLRTLQSFTERLLDVLRRRLASGQSPDHGTADPCRLARHDGFRRRSRVRGLRARPPAAFRAGERVGLCLPARAMRFPRALDDPGAGRHRPLLG